MQYTSDYPGGNAVFTPGDPELAARYGADEVIHVEPDLRDTFTDWFYWAFCVREAAGKTVYFDFSPKTWVGYYGPAVSHDMAHWVWAEDLGRGKAMDGCRGFLYTFGPRENRVYFAHDMLYRPRQFYQFCSRTGLEVQTLCTSEKGAAVPMVQLGEGDRAILLTARHHCCESTGSYVLQGVLEALQREPLPGYRIYAVPMVDYDGVMAGDQGKNRAPHDHNRDYIDEPLYAANRAITKLVQDIGFSYAFDFHSPWQYGENNDRLYIVQKRVEDLAEYDRFSDLLAEETESDPDCLRFTGEWNMRPDTGWNQSSEMYGAFTSFTNRTPGMRLSLSLETTYYGIPDGSYPKDRVSQDGLRRYGYAFVRALRRYLAL